MKVLKIIGAIIVGFFLLSMLAKMCNDDSPSSTSTSENHEEEPQSNWVKEFEVDGMTDDTIVLVSNTSKNEEHFDFPYDGGSTLNIVIRQKDGKKDVILQISKGQFSSSFGGETVDVRFDGGDVLKYQYNEPTNGDISHIFVQDVNGFISKLKASKKVKISPPFFQAGQKVFEFDTEGLEL